MNKHEEFLNNIEKIEEIIGYKFNEAKHALIAFTHSSYANENRLMSNERYEFLGDSVFNLIVSEKIFSQNPKMSEGELTRLRASIVCEQSLVKLSKAIKINSFILLGKGEELTGGRERESILADAFEALVGAVFLDGGFDSAKKFVLSWVDIDKEFENKKDSHFDFKVDYKTELQEYVQRFNDKKISYEIVSETGPDHDKIFTAVVKINGISYGTGYGRSKKEAEQMAAKEAVLKVYKELN